MFGTARSAGRILDATRNLGHGFRACASGAAQLSMECAETFPSNMPAASLASTIERKRKAVFVAGTMQHHGKTTVSLGMVHSLLQRGKRVAYQKPVGQQTVPVEVEGNIMEIDRDVDIFKYLWPNLVGSYADCSPVSFPPNFTRYVLDGKETPHQLCKRCVASFDKLVSESDYVVAEGTGHIGVGSIVGLNNAEVAAAFGLDVVIVAPGGLGSSFDLLAINHSMLQQHGVRLKGVILNKVEKDKVEMVRHYYSKALERIGARLMGVVPNDQSLASISFRDIARLLEAEVLTCKHNDLRYFLCTRLVLRESMLEDGRIPSKSLLIVNLARPDLIQALLEHYSTHQELTGEDLEGGVLLVGNEPPEEGVLKALDDLGVPSAYVHCLPYQDPDGLKMLHKVINQTHKFHRADVGRLRRACEHVAKHIDLDAIIA